MVEISFSVDGLFYTVPTEKGSDFVDIPRQAIPGEFWEKVDFTVDRKYIRKPFYHECMNLGPMFVFANYDEKKHHAMVEMPGQACDVFEMRQYLAAVMTRFKARITRLDLAIDVRGSRYGAQDLREAMKNGKVGCAVSEQTLYMDKSLGAAGATLYIGAQTTDQRIRVYDKGKEQATDEDWLRLEVVLRRERARAYAQSVVDEGVEVAARRFFGSAFVGWWELELWLSAGIQVERLKVAGKRNTGSEVWLNTVALKAVLDAIDRPDEVGFRIRDILLQKLISHK